jgi:hypothetical protein
MRIFDCLTGPAVRTPAKAFACAYSIAFIFQRLIYFESTPHVAASIAREKQINNRNGPPVIQDTLARWR